MSKTASKKKKSAMRSATDAEGSYTGTPYEGEDMRPVQDADDL